MSMAQSDFFACNTSQVLACCQPFAFPFPVIFEPYCDPGYYCPNIIVGLNYTYPQICPPTLACQQQRLGSKFCPAQGAFEPQLCPPGNYCPDFRTIVPCPEGTFCIRGSSKAQPCPFMSYCPPSSAQKLTYGGLVLTIAVDVLLLCMFLYNKYYREPTASKRRAAGRAAAADDRKAGEGFRSGSPNYTPPPSLSRDASVAYEMSREQLPRKSFGGEGTRTFRSPSTGYTHALDSEEVVGVGNPAVGTAKQVLEYGFRRCNASLRLELAFTDLGLDLPAPLSKTILSGVSGRIQPGKVTAVMGPSGAGKTTFMSVLMGKVARTNGTLDINGTKDEMHRYKKMIGYVPQEDTMIRDLTVRENILFSARMRLPRKGWTDEQIQKHVDAVIDVLGLTECGDTLIGDESARGVSGGQRKRTNIGIELAVAPAAIFLDEPTSGLDASAALEVCTTLRAIADLGLTVVAVIHQPRLEIFTSFDNILLLAPGGVTAYIGPCDGVIPYFRQLGYQFSAGNNPADELLDFVAGRDFNKVSVLRGAAMPRVASQELLAGSLDADVSMATEAELAFALLPGDPGAAPTRSGLTDSSAFFARQWAIHGPRVGTGISTADIIASPKAIAAGKSSANASPSTAVALNLDEMSAVRGASFLRQAYLCHNRSVLQQYRRISTFALEMGVAVLAGGMMGAAAEGLPGLYQGVLKLPYTLISPSPIELLLPSIGFYVALAVGLAGSPAGVLAFGEEKFVYFREAASGHNKLAYYLGKSISIMYRFVVGSLHFAGIFMILAKPTSGLEVLFVIVLTQFWCVYGLAAVMSMVVKRENSALLAVIVSMIVGCLSGYAPSLKQFDGWKLSFVPALSYARWGVEAWFQEETVLYRQNYMVEEVSAPIFGYTLNRFGFDMGICVLIGFVYRIVAYFLLISVSKDKQR